MTATTGIPFTPFIAAPRVLLESERRPREIASFSVAELCALAQLPNRITGGPAVRVVLHSGSDHFRAPRASYVGIGRSKFRPDRVSAIQVLEVLAHGFHEYAARENLRGRDLFQPPRRPGRPPLGARAMSPAERMRRMRAR